MALNPATPAKMLDYVLEEVDLVLVMSVNPGFGGQSFIDSQLRKIEAVRKQIDKNGLAVDLEVDGGIDAGDRPARDRRGRRRAGRRDRDLSRRRRSAMRRTSEDLRR